PRSYCVPTIKVLRHFRLRTEITNAAWSDDGAPAVSSPCGGNRADYQGIAGSNRPEVEDPGGEVQQRQYDEKENRYVALGQVKQPPHKSFTQIEQTGMA